MARSPRRRPGAPDWWTTDHWETPDDIIAEVQRVFQIPTFDLDPCCTAATAKAPVGYAFELGLDGLDLPWFGTVWVNPPYSDPSIWIAKAIGEIRRGHCDRVLLLLPADISTIWWRDLLVPHAEQYVWPGRIRFWGHDRQPLGSPKGGSLVAEIRPDTIDQGMVRLALWKDAADTADAGAVPEGSE